jgi:hypothetical protein
MATLEELRGEKTELEKKDKYKRELEDIGRERQKLANEIKVYKNKKYTEPIRKTFSTVKRASSSVSKNFTGFGKQLAPLGSQIKSYGNYLAGNTPSTPNKKIKTKNIYVKRGKKYIRVKIKRKQKVQAPQIRERNSLSISMMQPSMRWGF